MTRIHWGSKATCDAMFTSLCGFMVPTVAAHPTEVTCKLCHRVMAKGGDEKLRAVQYVEELASFPKPRPSRDVESKPLDPLYMTQPPISAGRLNCRCGMCETCHHFATIDAQYAGRLREAQRRLPVERRFRFAHVQAALEWYADLVEDGGLRRYGSPLGAVDKLGTRVSGSDVELAPMERLAWYVGAIREGLGECYLGPCKRCLSKDERLALMFDCSVGRRTTTKRGSIERVPVPMHEAAKGLGHGLDADSVGRIVREGLSTVYRVLRVRQVVG